MAPKPRKKSTTTKKEGEGNDADDDGTQVDTSAKRNKKKNPSSGAATKRKRGGGPGATQDQPLYKTAFKDFVTKTVATGVQGLLAEFDEIKKQTQAIGATPKVAFDTNPDKNRYKDVFCVDESRVTLQGGDKDYIHANWVDVAGGDKRRYICTQGPIVATIDDFWRMVWQEKCKSIVMLCNIVECGKKKCEQYWPETGEVKYGELTVKVTGKNEFEKLMTVTNLTVTDGAESHELEHILWNNWPDRGVPADKLTCFKLLEKLKKLSPTVIHCSAGIGRTGTIVGLDLIQAYLKLGEMKRAKDVVIELRARRHGSVQMDIQYLYIHRVLIAYGLSKGVLKESAVKSFIDAYESLCKQRGFL